MFADNTRVMPVGGGRSRFAQVDQPGFHARFAPVEFLVFPQGLFGRVEHQQPVVAVEQHFRARFQPRADIVQPDDGRDAQRTRHDGGVRGPTAGVGGKSQHKFPVEQRGVRRRQTVREQDVRIVDFRERWRRLAHQVHQDAPGHVMHVQRTLPQVRVVHLFEQARVTSSHLLENRFDVAPVAFQRPQHLVDERAIFHDEQVRVENAGVLRADGVGDPGLHLQDLRAGLQQRRLEPGNLCRKVLLGDGKFRRGLFLRAMDEETAPGETRRDAQTLETDFVVRRSSLAAHLKERFIGRTITLRQNSPARVVRGRQWLGRRQVPLPSRATSSPARRRASSVP